MPGMKLVEEAEQSEEEECMTEHCEDDEQVSDTIGINPFELNKLKCALKHHKKMLQAQQSLVTKEMLKDVCEMYNVEPTKLLWLMNFGVIGFKLTS